MRHVKPDRSRNREENRRDQDCVRSAHPIQKGNERDAATGRAQEVEKIHAVDAMNCVRDNQRQHGSRKEKRNCRNEISRDQFGRRHFARSVQQKCKTQNYRKGVSRGKNADFAVKSAAPARNQVRKDSARAEPKERDRNGQEGEVVEVDDRKYPR
ncbi:MAG TPA: hypothetical protein VJV74_15330 [Terriglobia bacterium]|nr:hypothetical protein [Terriglobia bacterium]